MSMLLQMSTYRSLSFVVEYQLQSHILSVPLNKYRVSQDLLLCCNPVSLVCFLKQPQQIFHNSDIFHQLAS